MSELTKGQIDKAGESFAKDYFKDKDDFLSKEMIFDEYRRIHLEPMTEVMLKLQNWLSDYKVPYYIAQRLKRKPQIIKKLHRLSVRLSQLQDIGGIRIIFDTNDNISDFMKFFDSKLIKSKYFSIERLIDYRDLGREDSGYRAVHFIMKRNGIKIELQLRSRIQHYWAESIERTSVIYGYNLKNLEGDQTVINYFKQLSNVFYEIECKRRPSNEIIDKLENLRKASELIIIESDKRNIFDSFVNESFIKGMISREAGLRSQFHNWMIAFDWNTGAFLEWAVIDGDSKQAINSYVEYEKRWPANEGYEVVLIGSSDVSTIRQTHSHYFGIRSYDGILEDIDPAKITFSKRKELDTDSRTILRTLHRRGNWGEKKVSLERLKNNFCHEVISFDDALENLTHMGFILSYAKGAVYSLNVKKKKEIEKYI